MNHSKPEGSKITCVRLTNILIKDHTNYYGNTGLGKHRNTLMSMPLQPQKQSKSFHNKILMPDSNKIFYEETYNKLKIKNFPERPLNNDEAKSISKKLNGHELSKIIVGDTIIDFGKVFVNSRAYSFFNIKNNLRSSISVKLLLSKI